MKIGIVGWGVETQSAYRYFGPEHDYLICSEEPRDDFPTENGRVKAQFISQRRTPGVTGNVADTSYLNGIEECDQIIYTPTSRKNLEQVYGADSPLWQKATTIQHIFFEKSPTKNIVGVTGSKGKGTTSTMIAKMLEAAGKKVFLGGNIGVPVLDILPQLSAEDWVVLELANFQLYKFPYSPHIGVCLMITTEHQDWHSDMDEYIRAKSNLFSHQTKDDVAIYKVGDVHAETIVGDSKGTKIPYGMHPGAYVREDGMIVVGETETEIIKTGELKLIGKHNWENVCAAVTAVWQVAQDSEALKKVLSVFSGLEHRLEFVREFDFVSFYDDSFATTPETVIVALHAFPQPEVLILGGWDKGLDYTELINQITRKDRVRHVITIGKIGPKLAEQLRAKGFNNITEGLEKMPDIVAEARRVAKAGDVVLLSTGSSSFGLFKDYKQRGDLFKQAVRELTLAEQ